MTPEMIAVEVMRGLWEAFLFTQAALFFWVLMTGFGMWRARRQTLRIQRAAATSTTMHDMVTIFRVINTPTGHDVYEARARGDIVASGFDTEQKLRAHLDRQGRRYSWLAEPVVVDFVSEARRAA